MTIHFYQDDIPYKLDFGASIAIDTETQGLNLQRDRLCLIQLSSGNGDAHLVQFEKKKYSAPNLRKLLSDKKTMKIFHFARFDLAAIRMYLEIQCTPVFCTRIASRLTRTYTDKHGLKDICSELIGVEISKQQQQSDWASSELSQNQREYAASDVLYLHQLKDVLEHRLKREHRVEIAKGCFDFLKYQVDLDIQGWGEQNIFAH